MGQKLLNGITVCNFAKIVARVLATTMFCAMTSHLITWLWRQHVAERLSARVLVGPCKRRSEQVRIFPGLIYKDRYCVIHGLGHGVLRGVWQKLEICSFRSMKLFGFFFSIKSCVLYCSPNLCAFSTRQKTRKSHRIRNIRLWMAIHDSNWWLLQLFSSTIYIRAVYTTRWISARWP